MLSEESRMAEAAERIADAVEAMLEPDQARRLDRLEAILLDLYPDTCHRHGLGLPAAPDPGMP